MAAAALRMWALGPPTYMPPHGPRGPCGAPVDRVPFPAFLIERDLVLFDTGVAPKAAGDPAAVYGDSARVLDFDFRAEHQIECQLAQWGHTFSDVGNVIASYLHFDHCGGAEAAPARGHVHRGRRARVRGQPGEVLPHLGAPTGDAVHTRAEYEGEIAYKGDPAEDEIPRADAPCGRLDQPRPVELGALRRRRRDPLTPFPPQHCGGRRARILSRLGTRHSCSQGSSRPRSPWCPARRCWWPRSSDRRAARPRCRA